MIQAVRINDYVFYDLSAYPFFARHKIKGYINLIFDEIVTRVKEGPMPNFYKYEQIEEAILVTYRDQISENTIMIICSTKVKPINITHFIKHLNQGAFTNSEYDKLIADYNKNPQKYDDKVDIINKKLVETKEILYQSIDKLIDREQNLDNLLNKTKNLEDGATIFYKKSEKLNRCCTIL